MKTKFKVSEANFGCYGENHEIIKGYKNKTFTIYQVLDSDIRLRDKFWFVRNNCDLTCRELSQMAIGVATIVLPIYENKYPNNKAPREALQAAQDYLNGTIDLSTLRDKRDAAYAAAYAADAAADAAYAADAAAAAYAAYAAYAAAAAYAAYAAAYADAAYAAAAAYAAYAADAGGGFSDKLLKFLKGFVNRGVTKL